MSDIPYKMWSQGYRDGYAAASGQDVPGTYVITSDEAEDYEAGRQAGADAYQREQAPDDRCDQQHCPQVATHELDDSTPGPNPRYCLWHGLKARQLVAGSHLTDGGQLVALTETAAIPVITSCHQPGCCEVGGEWRCATQ